jgi:predicted P-loop ATPase
MRSRLFSLVPHGNHMALCKQDYDQLRAPYRSDIETYEKTCVICQQCA